MQTVEEVRSALQGDGDVPVTSVAALVRLAIEDGRTMLAEHPNVTPDYSVWWMRDTIERSCAACLAGAVMLGTLDGFGKHRLDNCDVVDSHGLGIMYRPHQVSALCAIDRVRQGNIMGAYRALKMREAVDVHAIDRLFVRRHRRDPEHGARPKHMCFVNRDNFADHLDSLDELAAQLEVIEAEGVAA
ncbi:MAG: hypothetical protein F4Z31_07210 [Gemmatimonadetes bacterium]|nr:hypothetical protein [Gemmatimonadota bacterium]MYE94037.1 hypothetical protein [Gemmatimonadota bacterium]MYJ12186.1 hypothetical protein [Gemmatimonadota bacterium]